jgi:hypothetical protein
VGESYSKNAPDVASAAIIGAEEYGGLFALESNNVSDDFSVYQLRAPDGTRYRLTVERVSAPGAAPSEGQEGQG